MLSLTVALLLAHTAAAEAGRCYTYIYFYNDARLVHGPVNVECGGASDGWHSEPFGNWGVDSPYGRKRDGYQFSGWHSDDGWLQWNSCTSNYTVGSTKLPEVPQRASSHWHTNARLRNA